MVWLEIWPAVTASASWPSSCRVPPCHHRHTETIPVMVASPDNLQMQTHKLLPLTIPRRAAPHRPRPLNSLPSAAPLMAGSVSDKASSGGPHFRAVVLQAWAEFHFPFGRWRSTHTQNVKSSLPDCNHGSSRRVFFGWLRDSEEQPKLNNLMSIWNTTWKGVRVRINILFPSTVPQWYYSWFHKILLMEQLSAIVFQELCYKGWFWQNN